MKTCFVHRTVFVAAIFMLAGIRGYGQRYLSDYDSTMFMIDTLRPFLKRMENLHFSAYIQPQYQVAQSKGIHTYAGGDFQPRSGNRFMLRRARVKLDYRMAGKTGSFPAAVFTFQFEATERDVNVRDMFVRVFEPARHNFSLSAGLFARPFGYEVNLSSSFRESPERGRMSQTLMPSERDLGAMISYESQNVARKHPLFKFDVGVFNGQGKSGPAEFDSYKDIISRLSLKPMPLRKDILLSAGLSFLRGGWVQATKYRYEMDKASATASFRVDSNETNLGGRAPRYYQGADIQLVKKYKRGKTELRGEYWRGKQSGTVATTVNPGTVPLLPTFVRSFDGGFFYFLQNIVNDKWEVIVKYDWYDPNTEAEDLEVGKSGTNLTLTDIKFTTLGFGLTHYFNNNLKAIIYYDAVWNEKTSLADYSGDVKDNVLTFRIQMRF